MLIYNTMKTKLLLVFTLTFFSFSGFSQMYFPPNMGTWQTVDPATLGWCTTEWDTLDNYLESIDSRGFMVLYRGKIAHEEYYNGFAQSDTWYWASAAKSLVGFLTGRAQENGLLDINDKTSDYLGTGWTVCSPAKEDLITIRHQLTMTTGLDYTVPDLDCAEDTCLKYKADAGTQWYYHNAPYLLIKDVIATASGQNINTYTYQNVMQQTGMSGLWIGPQTFFSDMRSMARFGHLILNKAVWSGDTLLHDQVYLSDMLNSSQILNLLAHGL